MNKLLLKVPESIEQKVEEIGKGWKQWKIWRTSVRRVKDRGGENRFLELPWAMPVS